MAVTNIPNVQNWTVTPQNGQSGYFDLMNTWLGQSTLVIASLQSAITAQNLANAEINTLASQAENNAIIATGLANYQGEYSTLTTYSKSQSVSVGGLYYTSKVDGNSNHAVTDTNYWLPNPINDKVSVIGNETIAGVKTFSLSPIVPTPTTDPQVVNKYYADSKVALASFMGANQSLALSGYQKLPGGLIIQWGNTANITDGNGNFQITYPITFPTINLFCTFSLGEKIASEFPSSVILLNNAGEFGKSSMNINVTNYQNINVVGVMIRINWLVIGY